MKVTVWDVTNSRCNIRDYMDADEDTGRIYVQMEHMDTVLIDRTEELESLEKELLSAKNENEVYRKAIKSIESEVRRSVIRNTNNYGEGYLDGLNVALFLLEKNWRK